MTVPDWVHMADVPPAVNDEPCRHEWEWTDWMDGQSRVIEWIEWCRLCYRHRADVEEPAPLPKPRSRLRWVLLAIVVVIAWRRTR